MQEDVLTEFFCCDYDSCGGVCCKEGSSGAPLDESELQPLEDNYRIYSPLMTAEGVEAVKKNGFFSIDIDNDIVTPLIEGSGECAYTHKLPDGRLLCSMEKCGCLKPLSCSLYPVRVARHDDGNCELQLHRWDICRCAFEKGRKEGVRVYRFLEKPLKKAFGEDFYEALEAAAKYILNEQVQ